MWTILKPQSAIAPHGRKWMPSKRRAKTEPHYTSPLLARLVHYYHFVAQRSRETEAANVSSAQIADYVRIDDTQVRKDLAAIGVRGAPRVGYPAAEVQTRIRTVLGFDAACPAVLVGAGRLGGALALYPGFDEYGLKIAGLFDADPRKVGLHIGQIMILPLSDVKEVVRRNNVRLGILTVPAAAAQEIADLLVSAGVQALWNFAPVNLNVPRDVIVRHEHISVGLGELLYHLKRREGR